MLVKLNNDQRIASKQYANAYEDHRGKYDITVTIKPSEKPDWAALAQRQLNESIALLNKAKKLIYQLLDE